MFKCKNTIEYITQFTSFEGICAMAFGRESFLLPAIGNFVVIRSIIIIII